MSQKKTVLITGATSGIGLAFTKKYAQEGYRLILVSSNAEKLQREKEALLTWKPQLHVCVYPEDLSQIGAAERLYGRIAEDGHQVDILINNAGFGLVGPAHTLDAERERAMLQLLVVTPTELCKFYLSEMYRRREGIILNVASTGAFQPGPYNASYFAAKSYLYEYSRALSLEARGRGVQVCVLCPGTTRTAFFHKTGKRTPIWAMSADKVVEAAWDGMKRQQVIIVPGIMNRVLRYLPSGWKAKCVAVLKS
ncbi:MAG: SDR family oxidoreductase [Lachnospiraceae bacterium]|nr:SDR family oxidoreductase [Lachnospiraceae bacterium]